ncbi:MAG: 2-oxoglutarate dehydrogenase E1 component [Myxococcales bacterium FL481]|nr:MAG: 2-oxoglutarate dehydrogenase E1 component [Myxococcales bacterium FL481]
MDRNSVLSVHNLSFLEALYAAYERDPASVPAEWVSFLEETQLGTEPPTGAAARARSAANDDPLSDVALQHAVDDLVESYRLHGHLGADTDPLGRPTGMATPMLELESYGLEPEHLDLTFRSAGVFPGNATLRAIVERLRNTYCRHVGVEYWHLPSVEERTWLQQYMESHENRVVPEPQDQIELLRKLAYVDNVDRFLQNKFLGAKRFSIAGSESTICLLDWLIETAAEHGARELVMAMAHRGRLNVLMTILGKTPAEIFSEFERTDAHANMGGGDVKYHMGYHRYHTTRTGKDIYLALSFNPSHLEAITPVCQGRVRAGQDATRDAAGFAGSVGVTLHGDAAFAGQGVVAESLNLARLPGYTVGGMIRVIMNNQIGFTTEPHESRSGMYCTDVAHLLQVPVFHVNGDDPEAAAYVAKLALEYRQRFHREIIVDLVSYRRYGHNEGDDPTFTQPDMYRRIKAHPSIRAQYQARLLERGVVTQEACAAIDREFNEEFNSALTQARSGQPAHLRSPMHGVWTDYQGGREPLTDPKTAIDIDRIEGLGERLVTVPEGFAPHPKLARMLGTAAKMYTGDEPLNWAACELLAYASLVDDDIPVRITGQDAIRGTFSHRHAMLTDTHTGHRWSPLNEISDQQAPFEIHNSPLSEMSVLGFEFGYSLAAPKALVVWEAQFGDFVNGAQVIIDQFLSSSEDKWNRISGLTLLLPHGYEGQGPEHSSARLERFLQMCAEDNMQVVNPTTAAQMFHVLRRQVLRTWRKPLIVASPKSLLRLRASFSAREDLVSGTFARVLDDPSSQPETVERLLLCSGRLYYDLVDERARRDCDRVAIIRVEQLYPFPQAALSSCIERYPQAESLYWVQDEPENMGAWRAVAPALCELRNRRLVPNYAGRPASSSPATGSPDAHKLELQMILNTAFEGL